MSGVRVPGGVVHRRTREELADGMRRPCCWPGCTHRERNGRAEPTPTSS